MDVFINGLGNVSPQNTLNNEVFLQELRNEPCQAIWSVTPDYKSMIKGLNLRRLSRFLKNGMYSAMQCLSDAEENQLDAIICGTGLGCQGDTEKFLRNIYGNEEGVVSPTQFIQSTHNAISAQIALVLACKKYNFTYANRGASFESALLDAIMLFNEDANTILVGGLDELTESYLAITRRMGSWKDSERDQLDLLEIGGKGSIPGEAACFFLLSNQKSDKSYACLKGMNMIFHPEESNVIKTSIDQLLLDNKITKEQIDLVIYGFSGAEKTDAIYLELEKAYLKNINSTYYKHLCGEFKTSSAFAMWLASQILHKQNVPDCIKRTAFEQKPIKNILIYNSYQSNHSVFLLQHVES